MKNDSLGDRMKNYERAYKHKAVRKVPLLVRLDGKAFHTLTKTATKPFDRRIMDSMLSASCSTAKQIQGFKVGYVQSDEVTFLITDYDTIDTDSWFGNDQQKIVSITAAFMSVFFNRALELTDYNFTENPVFDSRIFSVPKEDVANAFVWRAKDWKRNSLQMYCQSMFSHKEMHGKNQSAQHDMLMHDGKSWANDLSNAQKNGTFFYYNDESMMIQDPTIRPEYDSIAKLIDPYL